MRQNSYYRNLREPFKIRCHVIATQSTPTAEKAVVAVNHLVASEILDP